VPGSDANVERRGPQELTVPAVARLSGSAVDWLYATTAQSGLGGRSCRIRGKVVGGSSAIREPHISRTA
jgi:hypothetical protein